MRRALLIGINIYDAQNIPDLQGCVSDVGKMRDLLAHHEDGTPNFSCTTLTTEGNGMVTRAVMREQIRELFGHDADAALLYFSGHGMIDGNRGVLVTQDCVDFDFGVPMTEILEETVRAPIREIIIILDCCHSGDLGGNPVLPSGHAVLKEGVSILTSSRSTQVSYEINGEGVFTSLLCDALNGEAADILGNVTAGSLYTYLDMALGAWDQRPLFKAHVSKQIPLRYCAPEVHPAALRKLPLYFPDKNDLHSLDEGYEYTSSIAEPAKVDIMADLVSFRNARLLVPEGAEHLYDAAMGGFACRLTPLGRFYWTLAKNDKI